MTHKELYGILCKAGIGVAHMRQKTKTPLPYIVYFEAYSTPLASDDGMFAESANWKVELYTEAKDAKLEDKLEAAMRAAGIVYEKNGRWIPEERFYQMLYEFEGVRVIE